ncbi:hypothetical protein Trydic_g12813 [Trypoxylus dichotomus]
MVNLANFVKHGKKIIGAAVNYKSVVEHRKIRTPTKPIVFLKPTSSYITEGQSIKIPENFVVTEEAELGVIIGRTCKQVKECDAMKYVGGYCLALDMTAHSELTPARQAGHPWVMGKSFDTACPVSRFLTHQQIKDPHDVEIWCEINGVLKQKGNTSDLIFNIPQMISYLSQTITLEECDLILTGTTIGDSVIGPGDIITLGIDDLITIAFPKLAKEQGTPWTIGKGFDTASPVSRFISSEEVKDPHNIEIWCKINGKLCQSGNTKDFIFNIPQLITYITQYMTLEPNDLILTGTPLGNQPINRGDTIEAGLQDIVIVKFNVE